MKLRPYQSEIANKALDIIADYGIVYLSMAVRTGKTITALHTASLCGADSVLFLTRKKAISSIEADARALGVKYSLHIANYEQLDRIAESIIDYDLFICDEAHCLGAFPKPSQRTKLLRQMVGGWPVIFLSGTPTPESWSQLYHQFWISERSPWAHYKNFYLWAKDYVEVKQRRFGHGLVNDYSKADMELIQRDTRHLFLSFSQEEAGFEAPVEEEVLHVKMKPTTYAFAEALRQRRVITNAEGQSVLADTEVKLMQKLHQIYSGTVIIDNPERNSSAFDNSKVEFIKHRFKGQRIAIFYKFVAEAVMLKAAFNWTEDPQEFNASTDKVFISQVQSGREGINLSTADALIMLNIDFSAVSYWQARARLQTKDRTAPAKVYWVFAQGGIEDKIYKVVQGKKDFTLNHFRKEYGITDTSRHHPQAA